MRLLSKRQISDDRTLEQKLVIDQGVKLARKVDTVRETLAKEKQTLSTFRDKTVGLVTQEITEAITRRESLKKELETLAEERRQLLMPVDLVKEWDEVHRQKQANDEWNIDLLQREVEVSEREGVYASTSQEQALLSETIAKEKHQAEMYLHNAKTGYEKVEQELAHASQIRAESESVAEQRDRELRAREEAIGYREKDMGLERIGLDTERQEIISEKRFLADQRAVLERGFAELRRKQK